MIKSNRGKTSLACAVVAASLLSFSAQSIFAGSATVKAVRGNPKYMGSNGFAVTLKKGDKVPAGVVVKTGANESIDLAIGEKGRLVSVAPNSRIKLAEDNSLSLEKGELVGSFRKTSGEGLAPVTLRTPTGVTQVGIGDISVNADNGTYTLLSGSAATLQPMTLEGNPAAPVSIPAGSTARNGAGNRVTVSQMSADVTANLLSRVDNLNSTDQTLAAAFKSGGNNSTPTTTQASPEPEPGDGPGTGTPGYWMNHPEAWPVTSITIGGTTYSVTTAIDMMRQSTTRDVTYSMFQALVAARLNGLVGNPTSCITAALAAANTWLTTYPLGSKVSGSSTAWTGSGGGESVKNVLDDYNNGELCAEARD